MYLFSKEKTRIILPCDAIDPAAHGSIPDILFELCPII